MLAGAAPAAAQVSIFKDEEAREKAAELEARIEQLEGSLRQLAAEAVKLNTSKQELLGIVRDLSGLIEEADLTSARHSSRIEELANRIESETEDLENRISSEYQEMADSMVSDDAQLYDQSLQSYHLLDWEVADKSLRELLLRYPDSSYAHAAKYWLGRIQLDLGNPAAAYDILIETVAKHPDSPRAPDALLLLEQIASDRRDPEASAHWSRQLLEQYPISAAADQRRRALAAQGS